MAVFTVYSKAGSHEDAIFVEDGFSWGAFLFTGLWALWNRMWIVAAVVIAALIALSTGTTAIGLSEGFAGLLNLALSLLFGLEAQDLKRWSLERRGYRQVGLISAADISEAELRFFGSVERDITIAPAQHSMPALPSVRGEPEPLGLFNTAG
jgi:hypothetical protein